MEHRDEDPGGLERISLHWELKLWMAGVPWATHQMSRRGTPGPSYKNIFYYYSIPSPSMARPPKDHIPEKLSDASLRLRQESAQRRQGQFIRGPIPAWWVMRAAALPGKVLAVGMAIWFKRGLTGTPENIAVTEKLAVRYGVKRKARYRALKMLEGAGLIEVDRQKGRSPRVTLLADKPKTETDIKPSERPKART